MENLPFSKENKQEKYEFFTLKEQRNNIFEASKGVAEYMKENSISNLLIADRSARLVYIGVKKYFEHTYPKDKVPNMYFLNPKGFKAIENLDSKEIYKTIVHCENQKEPYETTNEIRSKNEIQEEFKNTYKQLEEEKEKPVLIFDMCSHSGDSLKHIKTTLEEEGFSNLKFLTFNPPDEKSKIQSDSILKKEKTCEIFGQDRIVEKTFKHVHSTKNENPEQKERSIKLRKEIIKIINDYLSGKETFSYSENDQKADNLLILKGRIYKNKKEELELLIQRKNELSEEIEKMQDKIDYDDPKEISVMNDIISIKSNLERLIKEKEKILKEIEEEIKN